MALGGAFVAQADDATAAFANPAGLVQLLDPELSAELRVWLYSSDTDQGFSGPDSVVTDVSGVGFLSGVYPIGPVSLALYRNQLAKFEVDSASEVGDGALSGIRSFEITTWGFAGAYRVSEDVSVGLGVLYNEGEVETSENGVTQHSKSDEWGVNAGVMWKPTPSFNLGGFYRQGTDLEADEAAATIQSASTTVGVPDVFGLGVAYRTPGGSLALLAEWDHVRYSSLDGALLGDAVVEFDDANELHVGGEWAFLAIRPIVAIRVGAWRDPAHRWLVEGDTRTRVGNSETHTSSGVGLRWDHFQLDFAFDVSDPIVTLSISGIVSF